MADQRNNKSIQKGPIGMESENSKEAKNFQQDNEAFENDENEGDKIEMKKVSPSATPAGTLEPRRTSHDSAESYNPFEHREVAKPNSDFGSLSHMLKTSLGSGILAMPMAFRNSGLVVGMVGTILIGCICTHCIQMLVRSSQVLCKRKRVPILSFSKTAEVAFETGPRGARKWAKTAGVIITTELLLSFIMGNTVYTIFIAQSILQLWQTMDLYKRMLLYWCSFSQTDTYSLVAEFYSQPGIDIRLYVLMLWIPLILICLFRNLKSLVPFSIIANIFVVVSFGITLYYIFRYINPTESVYLVAPVERMPLFLTTVIFAIEGIGTVLPIENEMAHPEHFIGGRCGIAYISMSIVVSLYSIIGFFGYLQYGEKTEGSITLNLPVGDVMAQVVKILIATAIFFTYALQFYVPINIIWDLIKAKVPPKHHTLFNTGVRVGLVTLTIVLAIAIPKLEPIISLVGAICFSMLGLLLPSLIDTMTRWPNFGRFKWRLYKNVIIVLISLIALVAGTYVAILDIITTYKLRE